MTGKYLTKNCGYFFFFFTRWTLCSTWRCKCRPICCCQQDWTNVKNYLKARFDPRLNRSSLTEDEAGGLSQWAERKKWHKSWAVFFKRRPRFSDRDCVTVAVKHEFALTLLTQPSTWAKAHIAYVHWTEAENWSCHDLLVDLGLWLVIFADKHSRGHRTAFIYCNSSLIQQQR